MQPARLGNPELPACIKAKDAPESRKTPSDEQVGPSLRKSATVEANTPKSQKSPRALSRSKSTGSLRTMDAEWWVVPTSPADGGSFESAELEWSPPMQLAETWCGTEPVQPEGPLTRSCQQGLFAPVRKACSGKRHRYDWNGFDLDLAYVTTRVIAMGFPGTGLSASFRNPHSEVARFFKWAHKDHFRIYNLCAEPSHSHNGFPENTVNYPCFDHCPPPLPLLRDFCKDAENWLRACPDNVIVVHCKAGKGRTGTMICSLLVHAGAVGSAYQALRWYEYTRGGAWSGVTIPAQIRWVAMLERWLRHKDMGLTSDPMGSAFVAHRLRSIRLGPLKASVLDLKPGGPISLSVWLSRRADLSGKTATFHFTATVATVKEGSYLEAIIPDAPVWTDSDGLLTVHLKRHGGAGGARCGAAKERLKLKVWWHHAYLRQDGESDLILNVAKAWIDGLQRDMWNHKVTPATFKLTAFFEDLQNRDDARPAEQPTEVQTFASY